MISAALSNVFGEIHDGVVEVEQQLKKSPDAGAVAAPILSDIQTLKRQLQAIKTKLERAAPQRRR